MAAQLLWHNLKHDQGFSCIEEVYQSTIEQAEDELKYEIFDSGMRKMWVHFVILSRGSGWPQIIVIISTLLHFLFRDLKVSGCEASGWSQCPYHWSSHRLLHISDLHAKSFFHAINCCQHPCDTSSVALNRLLGVLEFSKGFRDKKKTKQRVPLLKALKKSSCDCAPLRWAIYPKLSNTL